MPVWQSILGCLSEKYNLYKKERFHKIIFAWAGNYCDVLEIAQVETVLRVGENSYMYAVNEKNKGP